jgi:hypothetical protein
MVVNEQPEAVRPGAFATVAAFRATVKALILNSSNLFKTNPIMAFSYGDDLKISSHSTPAQALFALTNRQY